MELIVILLVIGFAIVVVVMICSIIYDFIASIFKGIWRLVRGGG